MNRNQLSVRNCTSVGQRLPRDWEAKVESFRNFVKANLFGVKPEHFGNMDEVPVAFDMPQKRTVAQKGSKEVCIATSGNEKANFTVILCVTRNGYKCKPLIIFKRKTVPKCNFPKDVVVSANKKGWVNKEMMKLWLDKVWRVRPGGFFNPKSLLSLDSCPAHKNDEVLKLLNKVSTVAMIPGGLTKKLQPLDLSVNKVFKNELRKLWENYMFNISQKSNDVKIKKPSYELVSEWVSLAWNSVGENCIINGFLKALNDSDNSDTEIESELESDSDTDIGEIDKMFENFDIISNDEFDGFNSDCDELE